MIGLSLTLVREFSFLTNSRKGLGSGIGVKIYVINTI